MKSESRFPLDSILHRSLMKHPRLLIAGIGNIFLGDDAFGVEVVSLLAQRKLPDGVRVIDFGIRGMDLAYALLDGYDGVILVDSVSRGGTPGTLYVLEPELDGQTPDDANGGLEAHDLAPARVLRWARSLGPLPPIRIVGCEPATLDPEDAAGGLSPAVAEAVAEALAIVERLVRDWPGRRPTADSDSKSP